MNFRTLITVLAFSASALKAQDSSNAAVTSGPTLAETKLWIESEVEPLAHSRESSLLSMVLMTLERHAKQFRLAACELSWTLIDSATVRSRVKADTNVDVSILRVPLKEVDVEGVTVVEIGGDASNKATPLVRVPTRAASTGPKIQRRSQGADAKDVDFAPIPISTQQDGQRVAKAIRRAAELCGAKRSPF